jgi:Zn-dependent M28 family amino/carboxypeptidase
VPIAGAVNIDMVGYDGNGPMDLVAFTNAESVELAAAVAQLAQRYTRLRVDIVETDTGNSDHVSFWSHAMPAVSLWEGYDHNPYHHSELDMPESLTPAFLAEVARLALSVVLELGNARVRVDHAAR